MRSPGRTSCSWPGSRTERRLSTTDRTWTDGCRPSPSHVRREAERIDAGARWAEALRPSSREQQRVATSGPGTIHLLNGLYDAKIDSCCMHRACHSNPTHEGGLYEESGRIGVGVAGRRHREARRVVFLLLQRRDG